MALGKCNLVENIGWSSRSDELHFTTPDIRQEQEDISNSHLPEKSRDRYLTTYENFAQWQKTKNTTSFSEDILMAYFNELAINYKPSSMWAIYSMLKNTIKTKNNLDITSYTELTGFLKRVNSGFMSKKCKILTAADIKRFIDEAPDFKYLATKVALIFAITGGCRREELVKLTTDHIQQQGEILVVKIPGTKSKTLRTFVIEGEYFSIVKKYEALRSPKCPSNRFFQNYQYGKCFNQCIGINKFGAMPRQIAAYLELPEAESYTGHCFRHLGTVIADSGTDVTNPSRHRGSAWKSNPVAENYVEDSFESRPSTSTETNILPECLPTTSEDDYNIITTNTIKIETWPLTPMEKDDEN